MNAASISRRLRSGRIASLLTLFAMGAASAIGDTVALWLFDEPAGTYPSCILSDASPNNCALVLGRGAGIVDGRFGRALEPCDPASIDIHYDPQRLDQAATHIALFGLEPAPAAPGRTVAPMTWKTAEFAAFLTRGERHLRQPRMVNATETALNLGAFDWTVEFWFRSGGQTAAGTVFEVGEGPRGENDHVTRLVLDPVHARFELTNQPAGVQLGIPTNAEALRSGWHHYAFVYDAADHRLRHYVDGRFQPAPEPVALRALPVGDEAYFSVARDGWWQRPLPGAIDELRFSTGQVCRGEFPSPDSFSLAYSGRLPEPRLVAGPPPVFADPAHMPDPVPLGDRKYLFVDDALLVRSEHVSFVPNPPRYAGHVADGVRGHLSLVVDETGLIRLYYSAGPKVDRLAVMTSRDGVHWEKPDLGSEEVDGARNIVVHEPVGLGNVFIDPNGPPAYRYKYVSGVRDAALYVFTSADGWHFTRNQTAAIPLRAGSQSNTFYDDQFRVYRGYHRSDYGATPAGVNERRFVLTQTDDIMRPWPFHPVTEAETRAYPLRTRAAELDPAFLDNGPLSGPGFGIEYPLGFARTEGFDPLATDVYVPKIVKYPWAPDAYLAFPAMYFHYQADGPATRRELGRKEQNRGSGTVETQVAASRDGLHWRRYPRPVYLEPGTYDGIDTHMIYVTRGLVWRGDEIWQFFGGHAEGGTGYHSPWQAGAPAPLFRAVQRLDGFISANAPYDREAEMTTRRLIFAGDRLELNVDTGATGYAQIGLLDEHGVPLPGHSIDDCVYINGNSTHYIVEWLDAGSDLSAYDGRPVQVVIRFRGARLFALQFISHDSREH